MIIVTGATGRLGSRIVRRLLTRVPAERVGVSVRDVSRFEPLPGVRVRHGDYTDPSSLRAAFSGADQVLLVSAPTSGEEALRQHVAAVDAARDAGVRRLVYTSHQGAAADSRFAPMPDHAATEAHLAGAGIAYTSLRNGFYADTIPMLLGSALRTGELVAPADGPVSWTAHDDLAEAAAVILAAFDGAAPDASTGVATGGPTPPLTAGAALDLTDIAALLSELTGRTIRRVVADDDAWVAGLISHGVPDGQARMLLGMFHAARRGEFAVTAPDLERLIGRPATPVRSLLESVVAAGQPSPPTS